MNPIEKTIRDFVINNLDDRTYGDRYTPFDIEAELCIVQDRVQPVLESMFDEGLITVDEYGILHLS
jgi:hypothetical protein